MAAINISADRNPVSGKLQGSYVTVAEGVNFIGTTGHGNSLTITDSLGRFGTRTNIKPVLVMMGDSKTTSSLGRNVADYTAAASVLDTVFKRTNLNGSIRHNFKSYSGATGAIIGDGTSLVLDGDKPVITYVERYYDFDIADINYQSNTFFPTGAFVANQNYSITVSGQTATYNDATPTEAEFKSSLIAQINAFGLPVTASGVSGGVLVAPNTAGVALTITTTANIKSSSNIKTNRIWASPANTPTDSSSYIGYNGAEGSTSVRHSIENVDSVSHYYNVGVPAYQWVSETFLFNNSSASDVPDGYFEHWRNNTFLNVGKSEMVTWKTTGYPNKLRRYYLDEWSNGAGRGVTECNMYLAYLVVDDEWNSIWIGNAATKAACTKFVKLPQTFWLDNRVDVVQIETEVTLASAHFYVQTAKDTFVYLGTR